MDNQIASVLMEMIRRNRGDYKRIEHSLKVYGYAQLLVRMEGLSPEKQFILERCGWKVLRVSAREWHYSQKVCMDKIKQQFEGL